MPLRPNRPNNDEAVSTSMNFFLLPSYVLWGFKLLVPVFVCCVGSIVFIIFRFRFAVLLEL